MMFKVIFVLTILVSCSQSSSTSKENTGKQEQSSPKKNKDTGKKDKDKKKHPSSQQNPEKDNLDKPEVAPPPYEKDLLEDNHPPSNNDHVDSQGSNVGGQNLSDSDPNPQNLYSPRLYVDELNEEAKKKILGKATRNNNFYHTGTYVGDVEVPFEDGRKALFEKYQVTHNGLCGANTILTKFLSYDKSSILKAFDQIEAELVNSPTLKTVETPGWNPIYDKIKQTNNFRNLLQQAKATMLRIKSGNKKKISPQDNELLSRFLRQVALLHVIFWGSTERKKDYVQISLNYYENQDLFFRHLVDTQLGSTVVDRHVKDSKIKKSLNIINWKNKLVSAVKDESLFLRLYAEYMQEVASKLSKDHLYYELLEGELEEYLDDVKTKVPNTTQLLEKFFFNDLQGKDKDWWGRSEQNLLIFQFLEPNTRQSLFRDISPGVTVQSYLENRKDFLIMNTNNAMYDYLVPKKIPT